MLSFDESAYAAAWLAALRLMLFFPANNGHEGGRITFWLASQLARAFCLFHHVVAAAFVGVLKVAATASPGQSDVLPSCRLRRSSKHSGPLLAGSPQPHRDAC
jgi:hypothetical protein